MNNPKDMESSALIQTIGRLAGAQRRKTFSTAAEIAIRFGMTRFIETGCFRGNTEEGSSTLILAMLAHHSGGILKSYEIDKENIKKAKKYVADYSDSVIFVCGDSVKSIEDDPSSVQMAYLDSYDYSNETHEQSQTHHLNEARALMPKLKYPAVILIDDCGLEFGGKGGLVSHFLERHGWNLLLSGYQKLYFHN